MSRRYRLSLLMGCPAGGVSCTGTCSPRRCGSRRGACLLCRPPALPPRCLVGWRGCFGRLPTPPLVYFPAPIPPAPLPRRGRGGFFCFLMQGAAPLAFPALDRLRHLQNLPSRCQAGARWFWSPAYPATVVPEGGACFLCCLLTPPLAFFPAPIPPAPFPSGEGGDFFVFLCKGLRPLHPRH